MFGFIDKGRVWGREVTQYCWLLSPNTNDLLARENWNERQRRCERVAENEEVKERESELD